MLFLLIIVVLIIFYFALNESNSNKKSSGEARWISSPPNSSSDSFRSTSTSQGSSQVSTGNFERTTEGFMPEDNCDVCGSGWVKYANRSTGGKFFGCSNFPKCDNTRDKQRAKYFCSNGHKRTTTNTAFNSDASRRCLICRPIAENISTSDYLSPRKTVVDGSRYCRNGHKRTGENTYIRPDGERECRICRKNARR